MLDERHSDGTKKSRWTLEDDEKVADFQVQFGGKWNHNISNILMKAFPSRSIEAIRQKWYLVSKRWTIREDKQLIDTVNGAYFENRAQMKYWWKSMSVSIAHRTMHECVDHWFDILGPTRTYRKWQAEEDTKLRALHHDFGNDWERISDYFPRRSENIIRKRWHVTGVAESCDELYDDISRDMIKMATALLKCNTPVQGTENVSVESRSSTTKLTHQESDVNLSGQRRMYRKWHPEEDKKLKVLHSAYGNKWKRIANFFPTRSENMIRQRWNMIQPNNCSDGHDNGANKEIMNNQAVEDTKIVNNKSDNDTSDLKLQESEVKISSSHRTCRKWHPEEDKKLKELRSTYGNNWKMIAPFFPTRSRNTLKQRWHNLTNKKVTMQNIAALSKHNSSAEDSENLSVKSRSNISELSLEEYEDNLPAPRRLYRKWHPEEDKKLKELHSAYGNKWKRIALYFPTRSENTIRQRWNMIQPNNCSDYQFSGRSRYVINIANTSTQGSRNDSDKNQKSTTDLTHQESEEILPGPRRSCRKWHSEEDKKLKVLHSTYGNKWKRIAQFMPTRSENMVRQRWRKLKAAELRDELNDDISRDMIKTATTLLKVYSSCNGSDDN